jgi:hypothetical protein
MSAYIGVRQERTLRSASLKADDNADVFFGFLVVG